MDGLNVWSASQGPRYWDWNGRPTVSEILGANEGPACLEREEAATSTRLSIQRTEYMLRAISVYRHGGGTDRELVPVLGWVH